MRTMMNKVMLIGRLTADPTVGTTANGTKYARFTLAVDRDYGTKENRQTDFFDVTVWRNSAEFAEKYLHKGNLVATEGSVQVNTYTDKEGNKRRVYVIAANRVQPLGNNGKPQGTATETAPAEMPADMVVADDDLPF